jgi:hypothetical protein
VLKRKRLRSLAQSGTVFFLVCFPPSILGQQQAGKADDGRSGAAAKSEAAAPKLTPEQERGLRLLQAAEAAAGGLEPDMHAFVLWRASYSYAKVDPEKSRSLAAESFTAAQAIPDPSDSNPCGVTGSAGDIKSWIEGRILREMIHQNRVAEVEQLLPQSTTPVRNDITAELVTYYVGNKEPANAIALLAPLSNTGQYPYNAAAELLIALGPEHSEDQMMIFNQAQNTFQQYPKAGSAGQNDMGTFIERTWQHVPPAMALDAIDKMLDQAKSDDSHERLSMSSEKGSIGLKSRYQLRLFELLPMLSVLDKDQAESLLRDNAELQAQLSKYPRGMNSLSSANMYRVAVDDRKAPPAAEASVQEQIQDQVVRQESEIRKLSEKDPTQAISRALTLPVEDPFHFMSPRAQTLVDIAHLSVKKKPSAAKSALDEILRFEDQLTPQEMQGVSDVPQLYSQLGDQDAAKKALTLLLKAAEKLYAHDTDADDPNQAFKGTWPSADLWRKCIRIAAKLAPGLPEEIIAGIEDPGIAASEKVAFASSLLGAQGGPLIVSDCRKHNSSFRVSF